MAEDIDHDFLFPGPLWFIAPKRPYQSLKDLGRVVLRGFFDDNASGIPVPIVYVFSDRDLAERFIKKSGPQADSFAPLPMADDKQLIELLKELQSHGHQTLGADAEQLSANLLPIANLIDQLRRRQQGPGASPPSSGTAG